MSDLRSVSILARLKAHEPWWVEMFSGGTSVAWGAYVWTDGVPLSDLPFFDPMSKFVPDSFWLWWAIGGGLLQFAGAIMHWRTLRMLTAFSQMVLWKVFAVSILLSGQPSPGSMVYCGWAFACMAAFVRLAFR